MKWFANLLLINCSLMVLALGLIRLRVFRVMEFDARTNRSTPGWHISFSSRGWPGNADGKVFTFIEREYSFKEFLGFSETHGHLYAYYFGADMFAEPTAPKHAPVAPRVPFEHHRCRIAPAK